LQQANFINKSDALIERKIDSTTEGLKPQFENMLKILFDRSPNNGSLVSEFIASLKIEINLSVGHKRNISYSYYANYPNILETKVTKSYAGMMSWLS